MACWFVRPIGQTPAAAARIGKTLGRTDAEQFVIERFFALGFRNGHGNEPWLEQAAPKPPQLDPNKVKKARKQFGRWENSALFFVRSGQPQAADIPGAKIRQEALQPKGQISSFHSSTPLCMPR